MTALQDRPVARPRAERSPEALRLAGDPERSVRPADLPPAQREALRAGSQSAVKRGGGAGELPLLLLVALVLAFLIKTFLVQAFYIPSGSMLDTLQINDRVLVEKVSFRFRDPERGEVIVFRRPGAEEAATPAAVLRSFLEGLGLVAPNAEIDLIKRVIGLPGETIEIVDGRVHVDGAPLEEPYTLPDDRSFPPVTVPEGHYYMLGDNRSNSDDSRYGLGTVPRESVVGRAFVILWPPTHATFSLRHDYEAAPVAEAGGLPAGGQRAILRLSARSASGALCPPADVRVPPLAGGCAASPVHRPEATAP